jgi:hypothetical protein
MTQLMKEIMNGGIIGKQNRPNDHSGNKKDQCHLGNNIQRHPNGLMGEFIKCFEHASSSLIGLKNTLLMKTLR